MARQRIAVRADEAQGRMNVASRFLPYGRQTIGDDDIAAVASALHADFLTTGPRVQEFENAFAVATGARHAVACNSGTAALHLAALATDLGPGDAAIVPTLTFLATANVVRMTGAEVVFCDVDPQSGLMTEATLAAAIDQAGKKGLRPKAALPVHLNGNLCDMLALSQAGGKTNLMLIEDACHALGIDGIGATAHSSMACFSTHPVKAIATGEGGVVTTRDESTARRMRRLRSHGMVHDAAAFELPEMASEGGEANPWYYEMPEIGWNYRLPDVMCALGLSQLAKLGQFHARRLEIAALYDRLLRPLAPLLTPVLRGVAHGLHLYVALIDFAAIGTTRARFMQALRAERIGTQVHYIPVHLQPYYRLRYGAQDLPGANAYYRRCLSLPIFPSMSDDDVHYVSERLTALVRPHA
jgi:UDP-4-amino-4,6-dideoxy-N-acetyl-beta-L-altrosamine transaminase